MKRGAKTDDDMAEAAEAAFFSASVNNSASENGIGNKAFFESLFYDSGKKLRLNAEDKAVWAQVARTVRPLKQPADERAGNLSQRRKSRLRADGEKPDASIAAPAEARPAADNAQAMISAIQRGDLDLLSALVSEEKKIRKEAAAAQVKKSAVKFESIAAMLSANPHISPGVPPEGEPALPCGKPGVFDRGAYRKLARGQTPIEGRLDLHGHTQDEAHYALRYFIRGAQAQGRRHLLVITGKGRSSGSEGILQKLVPLWLAAPGLRVYIAAVEQAGRAHGGSGAFYIRLRRC